MKNLLLPAAILVLATAFLAFFGLLPALPTASSDTPKTKPPALPKRSPWTTSRVIGSPDPPHPFTIERAFPKLAFKNPLLMARTGDRFFIGEHAGKIFSFPDDQNVAKADLFFDLTTGLRWDRSRFSGIDAVYGLAFHPNFAKNRYCYVCYVLNSVKPGEQLPDGSRVSRFSVSATRTHRASIRRVKRCCSPG